MFSKTIVTKILIILSLTFGVSSEYQYDEVDLVCSTVHWDEFYNYGKFLFCESAPSSSLKTNINTRMNIVDETHIFGANFRYITALSFKNMQHFTFLPYGLSKKWNLRVFEIVDSGLVHIDYHDMQQFGTYIMYVRFFRTKLSTLESDLFQFNPNLIYISFEGNPLKFIDPVFFDNLSTMRNVNQVNMLKCKCLDKKFVNVRYKSNIISLKHSSEDCNDSAAFQEHLKIASRREFIITVQIRNDIEKIMNQFGRLIKQISSMNKTISNCEFKFHDMSEENNVTRKKIEYVQKDLEKLHDYQNEQTELTTKFSKLQNELKELQKDTQRNLKENDIIEEIKEIKTLISNIKTNQPKEAENLEIYLILIAVIVAGVTSFIFIMLSLRKMKNMTTIDKGIFHELKATTNHHIPHQFEETDSQEIYDCIDNCISEQFNGINFESHQSKDNLSELYAVVDKSKTKL